jgi:diguanylate cyclase (GGDEF)-like protein
MTEPVGTDASDALARMNRVLRTLRAGHRALLRASDEQALLRTMCRVLVDEGGYLIVWIGYAEHDAARTIRPVAHAGREEAFFNAARFSWDVARPSVSGEAIRTGTPSIGRLLRSDPLLTQWRANAGRRGYGAVSAFPLRASGEIIGCLTLVASDENAFDAAEAGLLQELADDLGYGIAHLRIEARHAEAERTIERMAFRDPLTGLPNRAAMRTRIGAAIAAAHERHRALAVLSIHVGHFDEISDTLGHEAGDRLLREVARRVADVAPVTEDRLARIGEDELTLLLPSADAEQATQVARRVAEALYRPVEIDGVQVDARSAIGIALYPGHGDDPDELMRRAKVAMYRARSRGGYALYSGPLDDERRQRLALIGDLRRAIEADELLLYCQPKAEVATCRLCGAEGLMRWQHPQQGMISPTIFVGLAENAGLITPLTHWVLETAFRERHRWHESDFEQPLAINLSARDLHDPGLVDRVRGLVSTWGTAPGSMQFELTESALMEEPQAVIETLERLRDLGIELMVDDYGTGYSSLRYLQQMPVTGIKIDQSFVRRMLTDADSAAIVRSTIELCHALKMRAIAEGVEDEPVWRALSLLGCDAVQGYYVGRPLPVGEFKAWASASRWASAATQGRMPS